jgi:hypothetical protein
LIVEALPEPPNPIFGAIGAAKEIHDPLAGLVERATTDPDAPVMPEAIEARAALRRDNRALSRRCARNPGEPEPARRHSMRQSPTRTAVKSGAGRHGPNS